MAESKTVGAKGAAEQYRRIIEVIERGAAPEAVPPLDAEQRREVRRLMKDEGLSRADAETQIREETEPSGIDENETEDDYATMAATRHRSYLPFVEAGLMTVHEAVREVGSNRSADGRGQERETMASGNGRRGRSRRSCWPRLVRHVSSPRCHSETGPRTPRRDRCPRRACVTSSARS